MSQDMNELLFDKITLTASFILILSSIITPMLNPFFRFRKKRAHDSNPTEGPATPPPISLILTPLDDANKLKENLPFFLQQHYPAGYQVVIVIEQGDHDAESIISSIVNNPDIANPFSEVYITCIPKSSRYISKKKLAITLGIKAARHEWILPTEASCRPSGDQWLAHMARHCNETNRMVMGYGRYEEETSSLRRFERLHESFYLMREYLKNQAYRTNNFNFLFRKSEFMNHDGYLGNLHLMRGEYDFLVNKYAPAGTTALEVAEEAWLIEDEPSDKTWLNKHLFYLESRKYLERGTWRRLLFNLDQAGLHANYLLITAAAIYAALMHNWVLLGASALAFLITGIFRGMLCKRASTDFGESISPVKALFYEVMLIWCNLNYMVRFRFADRNDFTTHKL